MPALLATLFAIVLTQGTPQEYNASNLPKVNGPRPPSYADPAGSNADMSRSTARRGVIDAVALPESDAITDSIIKDKIQGNAGWKAYQAIVPAGQTVKVRLTSPNETWFVLKTANQRGMTEKGMAPHSVTPINPQTTYVNSSKETKTIFFIVDTTDLSAPQVPYSLHVTVGN